MNTFSYTVRAVQVNTTPDGNVNLTFHVSADTFLSAAQKAEHTAAALNAVVVGISRPTWQVVNEQLDTNNYERVNLLGVKA